MTTTLTDTYKHVGVNHKNWPVTWKQNSLAGIRPRGCRSLVIAPLYGDRLALEVPGV